MEQAGVAAFSELSSSVVTVVQQVQKRVERRVQNLTGEAILISFKSWLSAVMGGRGIAFF
ncbi:MULTISPECIES: hypothetical protein [Paenibacillus]|uniref:hypothetical protein n=1 Tax=Paenibacillus TaxID=44249 RepID=UPI00115FD8DC|nr:MULTISPECIES: hypothetical protein [Paenibacillus]QLG38074.1 hypothetical protein HW560_08060 [Paenibacillus sp. E222]